MGLPGVHIEAKRVEALNIDKAMAQAERDAKPDEMPVVSHRKNGKGWKATLGLDDFVKLHKKAKAFEKIVDEQDDYVDFKCEYGEET